MNSRSMFVTMLAIAAGAEASLPPGALKIAKSSYKARNVPQVTKQSIKNSNKTKNYKTLKSLR